MPKKTYKTFSLKGLNLLLVNDEGERVEVVFRGGIHFDSTAKFTTADESLQKLIEKCKGFGRDYYLESVREDPKPDEPVAEKKAEPAKEPEKVLTDVKDIRRFKNLIEMKAAMVLVGISVTPEMNYAAAKAAAKKEGYDYQIQK